jgi:hypothetical protein
MTRLSALVATIALVRYPTAASRMTGRGQPRASGTVRPARISSGIQLLARQTF